MSLRILEISVLNPLSLGIKLQFVRSFHQIDGSVGEAVKISREPMTSLTNKPLDTAMKHLTQITVNT